jgi:hypothetical protein
VAWLIELLLFLLPLGAYALWRRLNPSAEPTSRVLALAAAGIALGLAAAVWYGFSRSMDRGVAYVPPRWEGDQVVPGHAEPRVPGHAEQAAPGRAGPGGDAVR